MTTNINRILEDVSDMFDQNIDPRVLRDRMTQVARTRELALDAAKAAEQKGNNELAAKLRADAADLQQILDLTRQNANIHKAETDPQSSSDSSGTSGASSSKSLPDEDGENFEDESEDAVENSKSNSEEEDDNFEAEAEKGEADDEAEDKDEAEDVESESEFDDGENSTNAEDLGEPGDSDTNTDSDLDKSVPEAETAQNSESETSEENSSSSANSSESAEEDEEDDDYDDENGAYGVPKVKDDVVLQDPFKNDQIETPIPKDMEDAIKNGALKIEPEMEAIIRILSKLSGEAKKGAIQALRDYHLKVDPWGNLEDAEDN